MYNLTLLVELKMQASASQSRKPVKIEERVTGNLRRKNCIKPCARESFCLVKPIWRWFDLVYRREKSARYMLPHPHDGGSNMALCCSCGGNLAPHTASEAKADCFPKKHCGYQPFLWCAIRRHTHIKSTGKAAFYSGTGSW